MPSVLFWAADLPRGFPYIETLLFPGFRWLLGRAWGPNLFGRSSETPTLQGTTLHVVPSVCAMGRQAVNISKHLRHRTVRTALKASRTLRQLGGRSSKIKKIFARARRGPRRCIRPFWIRLRSCSTNTVKPYGNETSRAAPSIHGVIDHKD